MNLTAIQIDQHQALLAEKVFQINTKWPHFRLLLKNIREWSEKLTEGSTVVSLERTMLYGGYSLVAPFFWKHKFISIDSSPTSADERGAYNRQMIEDPRFIKIPFTHRAPIDDTGLEKNSADFLIVPNLVHHIENQQVLFEEIHRILKPGGLVYIFEPTLRELHQIPDDYLRYTPYGLQNVLKMAGMVPLNFELEGGPFSAIAYCWTQALQYFPTEKRVQMEKWFYEEHFNQLMDWDAKYEKNLVREHTCFPVAFSVVARKPI